MFTDIDDALSFIAENDIKFIRLAFCDRTGTQKNISIMPTELERALTEGVAVDVSDLKTLGCRGELILRPDLSSFSVLPWRPSHGRVGRFFCGLLTRRDGRLYEGDCRALLSNAVAEANKCGLSFTIGSECEFYLFNTDGMGNPTSIPFDRAGSLDIAPADKGENVRREICLTLEEMAMTPVSSRHAAGPGQNCVVYRAADPETAADNFLTYKWAVSTIAAKSGLHASFEPQTLENGAANGCKLSITVNLCGADESAAESKLSSVLNGITERLSDMTAYMCTRRESYSRLNALIGGEGSMDIFAGTIESDARRGELKIALTDPCMNPYIVYTLLIRAAVAGFNGVKHESAAIPRSLEEAIDVAVRSEFILGALPKPLAASIKL